MTAGQAKAKRAFDFAVSLVGMSVLWPVFAVIATLIKLDTRGPVFFRQVRCGLNGRLFTLLKFRTMKPGAEERLSEISHLNEMTGPVFKVTHDPRLTTVGRKFDS